MIILALKADDVVMHLRLHVAPLQLPKPRPAFEPEGAGQVGQEAERSQNLIKPFTGKIVFPYPITKAKDIWTRVPVKGVDALNLLNLDSGRQTRPGATPQVQRLMTQSL